MFSTQLDRKSMGVYYSLSRFILAHALPAILSHGQAAVLVTGTLCICISFMNIGTYYLLTGLCASNTCAPEKASCSSIRSHPATLSRKLAPFTSKFCE